MLTSAKGLFGCRIKAADGDAGKLKDLYFGDRVWAVRFFLVGARRRIPWSRVLLDPLLIDHVDAEARAIRISQSLSQLRNALKPRQKLTVSQQEEFNVFVGAGTPAFGVPFPISGTRGTRMTDMLNARNGTGRGRSTRHGLRSARSLIGYSVDASFGPVGILDDFLLEYEYWSLRYLVVRLSDARKILLAVDRAGEISWSTRSIAVDTVRTEVERAPLYNPDSPAGMSDTKPVFRDSRSSASR